eukprot:scaffold600_cov385-Prasinococcus_capsulatus_cf.AAC.1
MGDARRVDSACRLADRGSRRLPSTSFSPHTPRPEIRPKGRAGQGRHIRTAPHGAMRGILDKIFYGFGQ